jgi:diketogulonate reductase-like aldo/keto reductase
LNFPPFIYGTAWKEDATATLTKTALSVGFVGIDTANQPRHYQEPLVGEAIAAMTSKGLSREKLFLQTKFTPRDGQDHRVPYDPSASYTTQVKQSFASSLKNLRTDYVDSYLLHGPYTSRGLCDADWEVWRAMEEIYKSGQAKAIGISNVNLDQLQILTEKSDIKPMAVQNRCYAIQGWNRTVREFCRENRIVYQGFSLLTANLMVMQDSRVQAIASRLRLTLPQVIFRYSIQAHMVPITGTTNEQHMKEDLHVLHVELTSDDVGLIDSIAG